MHTGHGKHLDGISWSLHHFSRRNPVHHGLIQLMNPRDILKDRGYDMH